jgi:hypothetical protein
MRPEGRAFVELAVRLRYGYKVTKVHEFIRVRKGDLKLGSDYLKRGELEDWVG